MREDVRHPQPAGASPLRALIVGALIGGLVGGIAGGAVARGTLGQDAPPPPFAGLPVASAPAAPAGAPSGDAVVDVVRDVGPTVVTVVTKQNGRPVASGSGFVVDAQQGYILTNNHVVTGETSNPGSGFDVIFADDRTVAGRLVGRDAETDVAVIQVSVSGLTLRSAQLGDSDQVPVGAQVVAIGSALGDFKNSVTAGVLSAKGRRFPNSAQVFLEDLLQTDAPISPGNSGGPLIWASTKQVVGMNTLVVREAGSEGLGFAISSKTFRQIADELIKNGSVQRGKLGIAYQLVSPRTALSLGLPSSASGAIVSQVAPGSGAATAGIRQGDVLTRINDQALGQDHPLATVMLRYRPGDRVRVSVFRDGREQVVEVTLGR